MVTEVGAARRECERLGRELERVCGDYERAQSEIERLKKEARLGAKRAETREGAMGGEEVKKLRAKVQMTRGEGGI